MPALPLPKKEEKEEKEEKKEKETNKSHLFDDEPEHFERVDKQVEEIIRAINVRFKQSFSIAVIGPWGNGKTSFFETIAKRLNCKSSNYLQIKFSPFLNYGDNDLAAEFLSVLAKELKLITVHLQKT